MNALVLVATKMKILYRANAFKVPVILAVGLGYSLSEVAGYFGRDVATVGTLIGKLTDPMQPDRGLMRDSHQLSE